MNTKLTNKEIELIKKTLDENKSDQVKEMEEIISNVEVNPDASLEEADITVAPNPLGNLVEVQADIEEATTDIYADLFEDAGIHEELDFENQELKDGLVIKAIKDILGIKDEDANKTLEVIKEYRSLSEEDRKEYKAYMALPYSIQKEINRMTGNTKTQRNNIARSFLDQIIRDSIIDEEIGKVKDLMGSVAKELDISNTIDMYTKYQKGLLEDNLKNHAIKLREEGQNDKADQLDKIAEAYHQSYTLDNIKNEIINNGGKFKFKPIELEKVESRVFNTFNIKYETSEFMIPNIMEALDVAIEKFPEYDVKDITKFFIIFCKFCKNYTPDNIEQHTFMYYTLMNIITLNFEDVNKDNEFAKSIRKSVSEVIDLIKEKY